MVIASIKALSLKYPAKTQTLMTYLSSMLRDEGGLEFKVAIAEAIITLIDENSEASEIGLSHLCEFIEDCEHSSLAIRVLHLLGREGPKSQNPHRYVFFKQFSGDYNGFFGFLFLKHTDTFVTFITE